MIKDGVQEQLDELRNTYRGLDEVLNTIGEKELQRYASVSALRVMYLPQIGFEIAIPMEFNTVEQVKIDMMPCGFRYQVGSVERNSDNDNYLVSHQNFCILQERLY